MQPGLSLLLAVLRGADHPIDAPWPQVFALARAHHVLPTFAVSLRNRCDPPEDLLANAEREIALESFFWSNQLCSLLHAFAQDEIPVLPLKGPFLAELIYGSAAMRPCRDLDLLVRSVHLAQAESLLLSLGFIAIGHPDDYHQGWQRQGVAVELHFNVENPLAFDLDLASAWDRATLATFQGQPAWRFHPHDEFLYLCLHGLRHGYQLLGYSLDLHRASQGLDLTAPLPTRTDTHRRLVALGAALAARFASDHPAPRGGLPSERKIRRLAERLWAKLLSQPPTLLTWTAQHRIYLQLEPTPVARMRRCVAYLKLLSIRTITADYDFAARFSLYRRWQVLLLRPIRLFMRSR